LCGGLQMPWAVTSHPQSSRDLAPSQEQASSARIKASCTLFKIAISHESAASAEPGSMAGVMRQAVWHTHHKNMNATFKRWTTSDTW
jgi:hypothetical protein